VDRVTRRGAVARTQGQALEVDGVVHIENPGAIVAGDFVPVRVTGATEHDLTAEIVALISGNG